MYRAQTVEIANLQQQDSLAHSNGEKNVSANNLKLYQNLSVQDKRKTMMVKAKSLAGPAIFTRIS